MDEMKKFIRYVVPGLVFFVELFAFIGIIFYFVDRSQLKVFMKLAKNMVAEGGPLSFVGLFFISGGVGAFFASIYHWFFNDWLARLNVNYAALLEKAKDENCIKIVNWKEEEVDPKEVSTTKQWRALTAFWHSNKQSSNFFETAESRAETIHDIMHGVGTQMISSFFVFLIIFLTMYHYCQGWDWWNWLWLFLPFMMCSIRCHAFRTVVITTQDVMSTFYYKEFITIKGSMINNEPVKLYVTHNKSK